MLKIGLTGGIGSGKTTVSKLFEELGVNIIDADIIAHQLVEKGQPALTQIARTFGNDMLLADGNLNRQQLRDHVFSIPAEKKKLDAIMHPLVYQRIELKLASLHAPYCIIVIPLLFETQASDFVDRILVIDCPVDIQIKRVKARDQLTDIRIKSIINAQISREFRNAHADDIIRNNAAAAELAAQVKKLHHLYNSLSTNQGLIN